MKKSVLFYLLLVLMLSGCSSTPVFNNTGVAAATPVPSGKNTSFLMAGKIDAVSQANILSKISAKVLRINADIGTVVHKGDPVILLDKQDIDAQIGQAQASVGIAQANLNKILSGARAEQIEQAVAGLESARQNYETVKSHVEKIRESYQSVSISKAELDTAENQLAVAAAQLKSAQEQYNILKNGETKETIQVYQAQLNQANAAYQTARTQLNNVTLSAPITGRVVARNIQEGELTIPSQPLITIIDTGNLVVNAYAPSSIAAQFREGQKVIVKVSDISDKVFDGKVMLINKSVEAKSKTVLVKVKIEGADPRIESGMIAEIGINK